MTAVAVTTRAAAASVQAGPGELKGDRILGVASQTQVGSDGHHGARVCEA